MLESNRLSSVFIDPDPVDMTKRPKTARGRRPREKQLMNVTYDVKSSESLPYLEEPISEGLMHPITQSTFDVTTDDPATFIEKARCAKRSDVTPSPPDDQTTSSGTAAMKDTISSFSKLHIDPFHSPSRCDYNGEQNLRETRKPSFVFDISASSSRCRTHDCNPSINCDFDEHRLSSKRTENLMPQTKRNNTPIPQPFSVVSEQQHGTERISDSASSFYNNPSVDNKERECTLPNFKERTASNELLINTSGSGGHYEETQELNSELLSVSQNSVCCQSVSDLDRTYSTNTKREFKSSRHSKYSPLRVPPCKISRDVDIRDGTDIRSRDNMSDFENDLVSHSLQDNSNDASSPESDSNKISLPYIAPHSKSVVVQLNGSACNSFSKNTYDRKPSTCSRNEDVEFLNFKADSWSSREQVEALNRKYARDTVSDNLVKLPLIKVPHGPLRRHSASSCLTSAPGHLLQTSFQKFVGREQKYSDNFVLPKIGSAKMPTPKVDRIFEANMKKLTAEGVFEARLNVWRRHRLRMMELELDDFEPLETQLRPTSS